MFGDLHAHGRVNQTLATSLIAPPSPLAGEAHDNRLGQRLQFLGAAAIEALKADFGAMLRGKGLPGIIVPIVADTDGQSVGRSQPVEKLEEESLHPQLIELLQYLRRGHGCAACIANDKERGQKIIRPAGTGSSRSSQ